MPKEPRTKMQSVGETLAHTAEAMTLASDPEKRAAAQAWHKKIIRELNRLAPQPLKKVA